VTPETIDLGTNGPKTTAVSGGENGNATLGRGFDQEWNVLVQRIGVVNIISEAVSGGELEAAAAEVHRSCLFAQTDVKTFSVMNRVVGNTLRVCDIGSQRQITVQRVLGSGPRDVDHGGVFPLYLGGDTSDIHGLRGSILLDKDIDTLKSGLGLGDARIGRNRVLC
jgi:hypothetical protein